MPAENISVFISYATEDYDIAKRLYDDLKQYGITPWLDRENLLVGQNWRQEIPRVIREHDYFLLLISENSVSRRGYIQKEQKIALDVLDEFPDGDIFIIPVRIDGTEPLDERLRDLHWTDLLSDYNAGLNNILKVFENHDPSRSHAPRGNATGTLRVPYSGTSGRRASEPAFPRGAWERDKTVIADTSSLPPTSADLFGRDRELKMLDSLWISPQKNIAVLVAWGGVGKTSLVNKWLSLMAAENFKGAERVFGWSFYSQGAGEGKQASADRFIDAALRWFRDPHPNEGDASAKGKRLAEFIHRHKTLLILDGLEPLQHPPGPEEGRLKDTGLKALLRSLAVQNSGLCVITTRLWVDDLKSSLGTSVEKMELSHLAPEDGAALLKHLGVDGTERELKKASEEFDGHALALTLLGTYLSTVCGGDVRQKDTIECLMTEEDRHGSHARRMMESYEKWMQTSEKGRRELNILRIMGLFDRPAESGAVAALLKEPEIRGLTDSLLQADLPEKNGFFQKLFPRKNKRISETEFWQKWQYAIQNLRDLRLILEKDKDRPDSLDCHPLIREHFAEKLRNADPDAWKQAHSRLYEYYKNLPEKELPDTLEEMEPLFAAVAHGCMAGRHQEAHDDVWFDRIRRKNEYYIVNQLGAFGSFLATLSNFFDKTWDKPTKNLKEDDIAVVLNGAGAGLRALGRLREAAQPIHAGMEASVKQEDWKGAAQDAGNLSELWLTIGDVAQAVSYARQSLEFADKSGDDPTRMFYRNGLANMLHQANHISESQRLFEESEAIQKQIQPQYPFLYSLQGFQYCDLLLTQGKYGEVLERASETIKIGIRNNWLLDIALDHLSLGKARLLQTQEQGSNDFTQADAYLHQAVDGLVKAGTQDYLPRGYLARAALYRIKKQFANAHADLDEAFEIADRSEMKLYLTDYHLESCRLCLAENNPDRAKEHLAAAKELIAQTGYHRRDKEAEELAGALLSEP
ncbi:MAG: TIR domain-containing protein [Desulfococcaceae bacterium]